MSIQARKRYGQHFLHDANIVDRIIHAVAPSKDEHFIEIGGGLGALTVPLAPLGATLDVVEIDTRLAAELKDRFAGNSDVRIHLADALKYNFSTLVPPGKKLRAVGNLPYNISTPLLFHLLNFRPNIIDMHFMLQKEVVDRMTAIPGTKSYGRLGIMLSRWTDIERCFDIRPGSFSPPPKVMSSFVKIQVRDEPRFALADEGRFAHLVRHLFSMRRKTLGRSLRGTISAEKLESLDIDPKARAETLSPEVLARLADALV